MPESKGRASGLVDLPRELEADLIEMGRRLADWNVEGTFLARSTIECYRARLDSAPLFHDFRESLLSTLRGAAGGYAVVRLRSIAQALGIDDRFLRLATAVLAEVATPFQPFRRWPLWKEIGTNLDANPGLSTGTGYNAFHMDLVNATQPPGLHDAFVRPARSARRRREHPLRRPRRGVASDDVKPLASG